MAQKKSITFLSSEIGPSASNVSVVSPFITESNVSFAKSSIR